jgi:glycosyltransferase involved in cell wall biosynthesis
MATVTVVTITFNEEKNIKDCLTSVRWADEVIVVDSGSKDRTVDVAREHATKVLLAPWNGYGAARNFALRHAAGDWVFWLDADERVTPELAAEIRRVVVENDVRHAGYSVARRAYFLGRWIRHCGWYPSRVIRLFRKGKGTFSENRVHEQLHVDGPVAPLSNDLLHFTDPTLHHYFTKFNKYTSLAAQDLKESGRSCSLSDLIIRPPFTFLKMYLIRLGFLDGMRGLILSMLSSLYVFTKYVKLWELTQR